MPIYFAAVVGTHYEPTARFTITHSSFVISPKGTPGDFGKMQKTAFAKLVCLATIVCNGNGNIMGKKMFSVKLSLENTG